MSKSLERYLQSLRDSSVQVTPNNGEHLVDGQAPIRLLFADGPELEANYWRIVRDGGEVISSFDHQKEYGLGSPLNAIRTLQTEVQGKTITEANLDKETGDLIFHFTGNIKLQVFSFTAYEIWRIRFPDGRMGLSNDVRPARRFLSHRE